MNGVTHSSRVHLHPARATTEIVYRSEEGKHEWGDSSIQRVHLPPIVVKGGGGGILYYVERKGKH